MLSKYVCGSSTGEPGDKTSEMGILFPSAQIFSITVFKRPHTNTLIFCLLFMPQNSHLSDFWCGQMIQMALQAAWRTEVCLVWRTAACFWSAAPSLRERSSTGSCRGPTMIASKRSVFVCVCVYVF